MPTKSKSQTITRGSGKGPLVERRLPTHRPPTHPGEMLLEEFLKPLGITQSAFAIQLGVSFPRLNEVINAKRSVTPDTALRLARGAGLPRLRAEQELLGRGRGGHRRRLPGPDARAALPGLALT